MDNYSMPSPNQTPQQQTGSVSLGSRKRSRQQEMMDRGFPQQGQQQVDPVVQTQGATYNPTPVSSQSAPQQNEQVSGFMQWASQNGQTTQQTQPAQTGPVNVAPQQPVNAAPAQPANQQNTVINTTVQQEPKKPKKEKPPKEPNEGGNKKMIFIIVACVLVVLVGGWFLLTKMKDKPEEEFYDPMEDPELEWIQPSPTPAFAYTLEEIARLREAGYTGNEIEDYQTACYDVNYLIQDAEAKRDAWIQEAIAPLYDTASPEYKESISDTWLSLEERTDMAQYSENIMLYQDRRNLDYEKVKVYGTQIFIKVFFDDDLHENYFFIQVTPQEYAKLNDRGNVIVNYTYQHSWVLNPQTNLYEEDRSNFFIVSASIEII